MGVELDRAPSPTSKETSAESSRERPVSPRPPAPPPPAAKLAAFPSPGRPLGAAPSPVPPTAAAPTDQGAGDDGATHGTRDDHVEASADQEPVSDEAIELAEVEEIADHTPSLQGLAAPEDPHDPRPGRESIDIEVPSAEPSGASAAIPPPLSLERGPIARFGRFDILGRLAVGGMADLLLARESAEGGASRHAVLKLIRGEFSEDSSFATMFLDEGRLAMRLTHPTICTVYECGREAGRFFMAMEYVEGETLQRVIARAAKHKAPLALPFLLRLFIQVAEALDFAHNVRDAKGRRLNIVHRDVSPNNIMVRYDGVVKLLDFGVAKAERNQSLTQSGAVKGKFSYMSPEQAMSEPVDVRSDIFSLGVCMFEAATARRLYRRKAQYDILKAVVQEPAPSILSVREDLPERLDAIILKALAKEPADRYQSAAELQHDLEELLAEQGVVVNTRTIATRMRELFADEMAAGPELDRSHAVKERFDALAAEAAPSVAAPLPPPRSRALWAAAAFVAVAGLSVGAGVALSGPGAEEPVVDAPIAPGGGLGAPAGPTAATPTTAVPAAAPGDRAVELAPTEPAPEPPASVAEASPEPGEPIESGTSGTGTDPEPEEEASTRSTASTSSARGRRRGRRGRRRPGSSTIVVDPGF